MTELRTERLTLTGVVREDAAFILELLNDPGWLANISDRGVRNLEDARTYIEARLSKSLWLVARDRSSDPIGIHGLIDRQGLPHRDIAYYPKLGPDRCRSKRQRSSSGLGLLTPFFQHTFAHGGWGA
jgi:hypothetical protein